LTHCGATAKGQNKISMSIAHFPANHLDQVERMVSTGKLESGL
jgi:hypothetical protein